MVTIINEVSRTGKRKISMEFMDGYSATALSVNAGVVVWASASKTPSHFLAGSYL